MDAQTVRPYRSCLAYSTTDALSLDTTVRPYRSRLAVFDKKQAHT